MMRLILFSFFAFILINQIDTQNEKPHIIVLGSSNSVMSRGVNAEVKVINQNKVTTVESSFGTIEIDNQIVDPKNGYVIEGNDDIDSSNCKSGPLANIIKSCNGKFIVRMRKVEDNNLFTNFNFNFGNLN